MYVCVLTGTEIDLPKLAQWVDVILFFESQVSEVSHAIISCMYC